jgi:glucokinase
MTDTVLAIDLGGTNFRVALMDRAGTVLRKDRQPTRIEEGPDATIARLIESARGLLRDSAPRAIGVAAPGPLDPFKGVILMAPNMPGWINVPLRDRLMAALGLPCVIDNDANLAGLGEQESGSDGFKDLCLGGGGRPGDVGDEDDFVGHGMRS